MTITYADRAELARFFEVASLDQPSSEGPRLDLAERTHVRRQPDPPEVTARPTAEARDVACAEMTLDDVEMAAVRRRLLTMPRRLQRALAAYYSGSNRISAVLPLVTKRGPAPWTNEPSPIERATELLAHAHLVYAETE